jgi:hypothetical protein
LGCLNRQTNKYLTNFKLIMMKSKTFKLGIFTSLLFSLLFFTSCEKEVVDTNDISTDTVQKSSEIDIISDNVSSIVEEAFITEESIVGRTSDAYRSFFPDCLIRTVVMTGNIRTVTLDFGDGCDMPNGNHLSGVITLEYVHDPTLYTRTITYSFTDFYFNYKNIVGGGSIYREWVNVNGNPQSTKMHDITVIWPDGATAHRTGIKVREWIDGVGTGTWGDNVYSITGNWTTEFPNGDVNTGLVTTALRRELACRFIVSGVIDLTHNGLAGTLDFGDGTCDNVAIFIGENGVEHTIILD